MRSHAMRCAAMRPSVPLPPPLAFPSLPAAATTVISTLMPPGALALSPSVLAPPLALALLPSAPFPPLVSSLFVECRQDCPISTPVVASADWVFWAAGARLANAMRASQARDGQRQALQRHAGTLSLLTVARPLCRPGRLFLALNRVGQISRGSITAWVRRYGSASPPGCPSAPVLAAQRKPSAASVSSRLPLETHHGTAYAMCQCTCALACAEKLASCSASAQIGRFQQPSCSVSR